MMVSIPMCGFATKKAFKSAIQDEIKQYDFGQVFYSAYLTFLITTQHHIYSLKGLVPEAFRKDKHPDYSSPSSYILKVNFGDGEWIGFSWVECLETKSPRESKKDRFRLAVKAETEEYGSNHLICEECGGKSCAVHHSSPTFNELVKMAEERTPVESEQRDFVVENHKFCLLVSLCKECHSKKHTKQVKCD